MTVSKKKQKGGKKPGSCKQLTNKYSCDEKKYHFQNVCYWDDTKSTCNNSKIISHPNTVTGITGNIFDITSRTGNQIIINTVKKLINDDYNLKIKESTSDLTYLEKLQKSKKTFNESSAAIDSEIKMIINNIVIHNKESENSKENANDFLISSLDTDNEFYPGMEPLNETDIITNIHNRILTKFTILLESNIFDKLFKQGEWKGTLVPSKLPRLYAAIGSQKYKKNCFTITTTKKMVDIFPLHGSENNPHLFPEAIAKGKLRAQSVLNPNFWKIIEQNAYKYDGIPTITIEMMQTYPEFKYFQSIKPIEVISSIVTTKDGDIKNISYTLDGVGRLENLKRGFLQCVDDKQHPLTKEILNTIEIEVYEYQFPLTFWRPTINNIHKLRAIDGLCDSPLDKSKIFKSWSGYNCKSECNKNDSYNYCYTDSLFGWDYSDCCNTEEDEKNEFKRLQRLDLML
jgi:hypothetical protein